jgi:putative endonuclease
MFYTYVLESLKDRKLYVGYTDDLKQRFSEHSNGRVDATKNRRPLKLVYYEACLSRHLALRRERYFKTGFGRRFLKERLGLDNLPLIE